MFMEHITNQKNLHFSCILTYFIHFVRGYRRPRFADGGDGVEA